MYETMDCFFLLLLTVAGKSVSCLESSEEPTPSSECTSASAPWDSKIFNVISEYAIASVLYNHIRTPNSDNPPEVSDVDPETKAQICADIIGNEFFSAMGYRLYAEEKGTDSHKKVLFEESSPDISPIEEEVLEVSDEQGNEVDRNPNTKVYVSLYGRRGPIEENGFVCPAHRPHKSDTITEFFISREYNVGLRPNSYIAGRFVFQPIYNPYLYVLAEQPAKAEFVDNVELYYIHAKEKKERAAIMSDDPLWLLEEEEIRRICLSVFNASRFDHEEDTLSRKDLRIHGEGRMVSFQTEDAKEIALSTQRQHKEWVVGCKNDAKFVLSQAYDDDKVFVYFLDGDTGDIYVDTLMSRVRFERTSSAKRS